jgi:hypothetical protein
VDHQPAEPVTAALTAGYGLVVADECHHVPAAAFESVAITGANLISRKGAAEGQAA